MGTYHLVANHSKQQVLDPGKVGGGSVKEGWVLNCGSLLAWLMTINWLGDQVVVVKDNQDEYVTVSHDYEDITIRALHGFNTYWPDHRIEEHQETS